MSRRISSYLRNAGVIDIMSIPILSFVFLVLATGGCSTEKENLSNLSDATGDNLSAQSAQNAGSSGEAEKNTTTNTSALGIDPDNPCSDPTIYTLDDVAALAGCSSISGNLEVSEDANDMTDFSGLSNLETVEGNVIVKAPNLNSFIGLSKLTSIGGALTVSSPGLTSLEGLNNLASVGSLNIFDCLALTDLSGLSSLTSVAGEFSISNSPNTASVLTGLQGLSALTSVGSLRIQRAIQVPTCEAQALRERLGLRADDPERAIICDTAQDECLPVKCTIIT